MANSRQKAGGYIHNAVLADASTALDALRELVSETLERIQEQNSRGRPDLPTLSVYLSQMIDPILTMRTKLDEAIDIAKGEIGASEAQTIREEQGEMAARIDMLQQQVNRLASQVDNFCVMARED